MRRTLIIAILLMPFFIKAQEFFLGDKREMISDAMKSGNTPLVQSDLTDDGRYAFDIYALNENNRLVFYFESDDVCTLIAHIMANSMLVPAIRDLGERFRKYSDNEWISHDLRTLVKLNVGTEFFTVVYESVD
ncbi:hypothetical protein [Parapedobacter defluvii]|nr:hypothetical protein [Parapedobacter defluvii]